MTVQASEKLKITTFQAYLFWENIDTNLKNIELKLDGKMISGTDIIILPEMFNSGFSMNVEKLAEEMQGKTMQWMLKIAQKYQCVVAGSLIIKEAGNFYNRLIWMRADGSFEFYDKIHLFSMGKEDEFFTPGTATKMVELKGWKFALGICYDLRFPCTFRNSYQNPYDILLFVASWPDMRIAHWRNLIIARAIENQSFVLGVNRFGYDGNEVYHSGHSMCITPYGETVYYKPEDEDLYTFYIHYEEVRKSRNQFPFLKDAEKHQK